MQLVFGVHTNFKNACCSHSLRTFPHSLILVLFQRIFGVLQIDRCLFKGIAVHADVVFGISGFSFFRELCCYSSNISQRFVGNLKSLMAFDRLIAPSTEKFATEGREIVKHLTTMKG